MKKSIKITVFGVVQGVGYREYVQKYAKKFGIEGVVQNLDDGSVQIYASGEPSLLDNFIDYVYKGTARSDVEEIAIEIANNGRDFRKVFRIIGME